MKCIISGKPNSIKSSESCLCQSPSQKYYICVYIYLCAYSSVNLSECYIGGCVVYAVGCTEGSVGCVIAVFGYGAGDG